jgi:hypothetical protein
LVRERFPIDRAGLMKPQNFGLLEDPRREVFVAGAFFLVSSRQHMHNPKGGKITTDAAIILTKPSGGRF